MAKNKSGQGSKPQSKANKENRKPSPENHQNGAKSSSSNPSDDNHGISIWSALLIASVALSLGVLTPPLLFSSSNSQSKKKRSQQSFFSIIKEGGDVRQLGVENNDAPPMLSESSSSPTPSSPVFPCTERVLKDFWHDTPVRGYHIGCLERSPSDKNVLDLTLFRGGIESTRTSIPVRSTIQWQELRRIMENELGLPTPGNDYNFQPWATFSPVGHRLLDANMEEEDENDDLFIDTTMHFGTFLIYEGGQWLWPGVRVGFKREIELYAVMPIDSPEDSGRGKNRKATIETLSLVPLVVSVQGFLSDDECRYIQEKAGPTMEYSEVVLMDKDAGRPATDFRTSQSTFMSSHNDDLLTDIDYRTASLTRIPIAHQEHVQVLRYGLNEKYDSHTDFFDPALYKNDAQTLETIGHGRRNRIATVFWYLSDVKHGGETAFPRHNGSQPRTMQECTGLLVKPEKGKVIIFYSLTMDGETDDYSLHAACPVKDGVKWAANKWVWNEPMPYMDMR